MMRMIIFAAMIAGLLGAEAAAEDRAADRAAITHAKVETWRSLYRTQNAEGLDRFLKDGFILIGDDGSVTAKQEEVAWLAANAWGGPDDFVYTVEDIIFTSETTAIVYGHGDSTGEDEDGRPCRQTYWSSNTLVKEGGAWRPIFSHVSGARCDLIE